MDNREEVYKKLQELQRKIKYQFKDVNILRHALTHTSYANEFYSSKKDSNERLEFLGDAILEMVSSEYFFNQLKDHEEGELTKIRSDYVCEKALALSAKKFDLSNYILLGKGEEKTGGRNRDSIVSDAVEAVIAAIYLDGGFEAAKKFILEYIICLEENFQNDNKDYKTELQVIMQKNFNTVPQYILINENGPDHNKEFIFGILFKDEICVQGKGRSKKRAEQEAAKSMIDYLNKNMSKLGGIDK